MKAGRKTLQPWISLARWRWRWQCRMGWHNWSVPFGRDLATGLTVLHCGRCGAWWQSRSGSGPSRPGPLKALQEMSPRSGLAGVVPFAVLVIVCGLAWLKPANARTDKSLYSAQPASFASFSPSAIRLDQATTNAIVTQRGNSDAAARLLDAAHLSATTTVSLTNGVGTWPVALASNITAMTERRQTASHPFEGKGPAPVYLPDILKTDPD